MATFYFIWIIRVRLKGKRYPIQIQKNQNIRQDLTPKSGSSTPLTETHLMTSKFVDFAEIYKKFRNHFRVDLFEFLAFFRPLLIVFYQQIDETKKSLNYRSFTKPFLCDIQRPKTIGCDRDLQLWRPTLSKMGLETSSYTETWFRDSITGKLFNFLPAI